MTFKQSILLTILLFSLLITSNAQTTAADSKPLKQITADNNDVPAALDDYFQKAAGLGLSGAVLVAKDGKVIAREGYGWADVKRRIPITADRVFDIGSNTKVFTAIAVMQLELFKGRTINVSFAENGKLIVYTKDGDVAARKISKL